MQKLVDERGFSDEIELDSAGTGGWHVGHSPDGRATEAARRRGIEMTGRARQVSTADFEEFDLLVAMDSDNYGDLVTLAGGDDGKVRLLRDYADGEGLPVPDPYYGGDDGFEEVLDIVERNCAALLEEVSPGRVQE